MNKHFSRVWLVVLIVFVVAGGIVAVSNLRARQVQAADRTAGATYSCYPDRVVSANNRVVAHCATPILVNGTTNIYWFAYPTKDSANASRMLSIFETAKATSSTVTFYFDTNDLSGGDYGCDTSNCRAIWAATTP